MIVYLIRHGETDENRKRCLQGSRDIPLNENGRELARQTAEALKEVTFDRIYSSPLSRALETAKILKRDREIPIIIEDRIREISFGIYEGLCSSRKAYNIPDPDFPDFFQAPERYVTPPEGESFEEIIARTGAFWQELIRKEELQKKTILVATHGCALNALLANIRPVELKDFWGEGVHPNCSITKISVEHGKATILEEGKVYAL